jgi:hypothetical protein
LKDRGILDQLESRTFQHPLLQLRMEYYKHLFPPSEQ